MFWLLQIILLAIAELTHRQRLEKTKPVFLKKYSTSAHALKYEHIIIAIGCYAKMFLSPFLQTKTNTLKTTNKNNNKIMFKLAFRLDDLKNDVENS